VVHTLERLQNQGDDKAGQFLASIMRFQFIIALVIAKHILHSTVEIRQYCFGVSAGRLALEVCLPPRLGILSHISKDLAKLSAD
jgi:hypothetical protein